MKEFIIERSFDPDQCKIDYKKELNEEQLDVVLNGDGLCLVLAGAGSGKTRTITYRLAYLVERGVSPENILLVTFTNKAAKEMVSRVEMLLGGYPTGLWAGTFHSVANRLLRKFAYKLGYTPNFTILDTEDSKTLLKICIKDMKIDTKARRFPSPAVLLGIISYARNSCRGIGDVIESKYSNFIDIISTVDRIAELYKDRKLQADAMDFDDLIIKVRDLLEQDPVVRDSLAAQFQYVMVDEYQDTNRVQADIVNKLSSVHQNILVVGDDAQSIYSFRAAEIRNILDFSQRPEKTKIFKLTTNYRSTPEILSLANTIITNNENQFRKELRSVMDGFDKPSLVPAANKAQEAAYTAEQILQLRDEGVAMAEIAVLFRASFHSQALELELMKRDIPYEYRGGMKFFERAHVKDVVAYMRLLANAKDEMAWVRVLSHQPGIGLVTAGKIVAKVQGAGSLEEILAVDLETELASRAKAGWKGFCSVAGAMLSANGIPAEIIRSLASSQYRDYLEAEYPDMMDRLDDLEQFSLFAEQYDDLNRFLDEVSLSTDYGAVREKGGVTDDEKIVLSTIHQAKGLEWDCVFVMNLSDGAFPNQRALAEDGGLEEERRLFYVAVTRARRHLFLTYPVTDGYDTLMMSAPSIFLQEIPKKLLEEVRLREVFSPGRGSFETDDYEPVIFLDDDGEPVSPPPTKSYLREISEL